jgi:hypothetical protein
MITFVNTDEHLVLQHHGVVERDIVLDLATVPDDRATAHEAVLSEGAAGADPRPGHDVAEVPDARAGADRCRPLDDGRSMSPETSVHNQV